MRNGLKWVVGFAISFSVVVLFLLVYSLAQPSLWLPVLFGVIFCGLLSFSPRVSAEGRIGLATLFGSVSCILWMVSGTEVFRTSQVAVQLAFENVLGVVGLVGLVIALGEFRKPAGQRPAIIPILLLMITGWLISYFSSTHGGSEPMVTWFMSHFGMDQDSAERAVLFTRKGIHFLFYATVASCGYSVAISNGARRSACIIAALLTTLAYASFDEMRQSSQPGRTGSAWDVLLDMTGGSTALIFIAAFSKPEKVRRPKRDEKSSTL